MSEYRVVIKPKDGPEIEFETYDLKEARALRNVIDPDAAEVSILVRSVEWEPVE